MTESNAMHRDAACIEEAILLLAVNNYFDQFLYSLCLTNLTDLLMNTKFKPLLPTINSSFCHPCDT
jgi:hypothetical protein